MNSVMYSSNSEEWETPQELYDKLDAEFHFTLDPCAAAENAKCARYYTKSDDGLRQSWAGERVFCNPPYGRAVGLWCKKSYDESRSGALVVMLLPARTDTRWFHDWALGKAELQFLRGRLKFGGSVNAAPFPSMLAVYKQN